MYGSGILEYYSTHKASDVSPRADDCQRYAKRGAVMKHQRRLTVIPSNTQKVLVTVEILVNLYYM